MIYILHTALGYYAGTRIDGRVTTFTSNKQDAHHFTSVRRRSQVAQLLPQLESITGRPVAIIPLPRAVRVRCVEDFQRAAA